MIVGTGGFCNNCGASINKVVNKKKGGNDDENYKEDIDNIDDLYISENQNGGAKKNKGSKVVAKRALSPYNKFVKKHFAILKNKFPNEKATQIMKLISDEWKKHKLNNNNSNN